MALSDVKRAEILDMSNAGVKSPKITATFDVSERTVRRILAQYKERGTVLTKKSPGRPCDTGSVRPAPQISLDARTSYPSQDTHESTLAM
ncbi:hypothetical protein BGZ47_000423 [Haplosporangium gracile]|nr:hypothetical protein BGZ47_000423 [Haplosporangium gracile]